MPDVDFSPGSPLASLFHQAWGQAKDSPTYDKKVWRRLDELLKGQPDPRDQPTSTR